MVVKDTISKELADKIKEWTNIESVRNYESDGYRIVYQTDIEAFIDSITEVKPPELIEAIKNMAERKQQQEDFYDGKFYDQEKIEPLVKPERPMSIFDSFDLFGTKINELIDRVNNG